VTEALYSDVLIDPHVQIDFERDEGDLFGSKKVLIDYGYENIKKMAKAYNLDLIVNITPGVSDVIVEKYPETAVVDVHGRRSPHWLCPSNVEVRKYFSTRLRDMMGKMDVGEIELDVVSINVYDPQVVPDWVSPELSPLTEIGAASCFCSHCMEAARQAGLDIEKIKREVKAIASDAQQLSKEQFFLQSDTIRSAFDMVRYILRHPHLVQWLNFRATAVNDFVNTMRNTVKNTNSNTKLSCDLVSPSFSWKLGQRYETQHEVSDMTKLMLYHKRIGSFEAKPLKRLAAAIPDVSEETVLDQYYRLRGFSGPSLMQDFNQQGLDVKNVFYEVKKAKESANKNHPIIAGLVGDPPATPNDVEQAVEMAHSGGADGYMLHLWYHDSPRENITAFGEKIKELNTQKNGE
jgi:hypothetical protein